MAANYDTQILAMVAAAFISSDGSTATTYGCAITRNSTGVYTLILPTGEGLIDPQSFVRVTAKASIVTTGITTPVMTVATNLADTFSKQVNCFSNNDGSPTDSDLEIVVQRTVTYPLDTTTPEF
jgi:hypothetical protein